ncbi:MAG: LppX_LprAFG lipoprotein [Chloroflexota bacterium]|nr:LppX_LprAFG lipoprotein [Chloroflexota bacterium]
MKDQVLKNRIRFIIVACMVFCAGFAGAQEGPLAEPQALLDRSVELLQSADSFRLAIAQSGAPHQLALTFDGVNMLPATLRSAEAQVISPNELYISARVQLVIPLSLEIYSRDDRQWLSFPSGAPWWQLPAFEGFDVSRLLAPDDGIDRVMTDLQDPKLVDSEALVDDQLAWHIQAIAAGDAVEGLLFGFIDPQDDVLLDAYITADSGRLALIEILMLETAGDPNAEPSVWHIRFFDYDGPRGFEAPVP